MLGVRSALAASVICALTANAHAQTGVSNDRVSLPDGPGSLEGIGENAGVDGNMGTMLQQVPIAVPGGFAGVTPNLALSYSSGGGASSVGMGWSLEVPSIERMTYRGNTTMGNLLGGGPPGTGTAELVIDGQAITLSNVTARVGQVAGSTVYLTVNAGAPGGGTWKIELELDPNRVRPSTSALDWLTDSVSIHAPGEVGGSVVIGYGGPGTVVLDQADLTPGTPFSGTLSGQVTATQRAEP